MTPLRDAFGQVQPGFGQAPEPGESADLVAALSQLMPASQPAAAVLDRLRERVLASREANAHMHNVRRPTRQPALPGWPEGLRAYALHRDSWLLDLDAGCALPQREGCYELLVLEGRLGDGSDAAPLARMGYWVGGASQQQLRAEVASRLYLRQHRAGQDPYSVPAQAHRVGTQAWQPLREGVSICPLYGEGGAVSMLARFQAGSRVPAHPHGIDEECLMVEGDLFLGDLLLPEGGYQFAPAGTQHGDLFADKDCVLFFHGAVDAQAIDNTYRAAQGWPAL